MKEKFLKLKKYFSIFSFKRLSLAKKMGLYVGILTICALGTAFSTYLLSKDLNILVKAGQTSYQSSTTGVYIADSFKALEQLKWRTIVFIRDIDAGKTVDGEELEFDVDELNDSLTNMGAEALGLGLKKDVDKLDKMWKKKYEGYKNAVKFINDGKFQEAKTVLGNIASQYEPLFELLTAFKEHNSTLAGDAYKKTYIVKGASVNRIYVISGIILALAIVGIIFFTFMVKGLKHISDTIYNSTSELLTQSSSLSNVSTNMKNIITRQQESLTESVSAIDEITAMNKRTLDISKNTTKAADECRSGGEQGRELFNSVLKSINDINESNKNIGTEVERSGSEVKEIIEIINQIADKAKVINDIVFQTKLLSFNASVEAARAGEHGKGFSVVAEEVGALASMSGKAADEISSLLNESVQKVESTIENSQSRMGKIIDENSNVVDKSLNLARECSDSMNTIVSEIQGLSTQMNEVTGASQEQARGVEDVSAGLQSLHDASTESVSLSTEVSLASENLDKFSNNLNSVVLNLKSIIEGEKAKTKRDDNNNKPKQNVETKKNVKTELKVISA